MTITLQYFLEYQVISFPHPLHPFDSVPCLTGPPGVCLACPLGQRASKPRATVAVHLSWGPFVKCARCQNRNLWAFQAGCTAEQTGEVAMSARLGLSQARSPPVPQLKLAGSQPGRPRRTWKAGRRAPGAPNVAVRPWESLSPSFASASATTEDSQYSSASRAGVGSGQREAIPPIPTVGTPARPSPRPWLVDNKN